MLLRLGGHLGTPGAFGPVEPSEPRAGMLEALASEFDHADGVIAVSRLRLRQWWAQAMLPLVLALAAGWCLHPLAGLAGLIGWALLSQAQRRLDRFVLLRASPERILADADAPVRRALLVGELWLVLAGLIALRAADPIALPALPALLMGAGAVAGAATPVTPADVRVLRPALWLLAGAGFALADLLAGQEAAGLTGLFGLVAIGWAMLCGLTPLRADAAAERRARRVADAARECASRRLREKDRFFAVVSHELRTPLNAILGLAQSLAAGDRPRPEREKAQVIADAGRTLTALLGDVLDLSKLEAGHLTIQPMPESFHATLEHVLTLYRPLADERGIAIGLTIGHEVPDWLEHDAVRVRQCLSNLVSNAIKFTAAGEVRVTASSRLLSEVPQRRHAITIRVRDTGIGVPEASRERLFEPFAQADGSISGRFGGTGLGLHIARRLARRMGGDIRCEGEGGPGAVFSFGIEAVQVSAPAAVSPAPAVEGTGLRVLVADDVATNRMVMRLLLAPMGIAVVEAADGTVACRILRARQVDAALLDLRMPGLTGQELVALIRQGRAGDSDLPVLAVTADDSLTREAMCAAGFDGLVTKPLDQRALQTALVTTLAARLVGRSCRGGVA